MVTNTIVSKNPTLPMILLVGRGVDWFRVYAIIMLVGARATLNIIMLSLAWPSAHEHINPIFLFWGHPIGWTSILEPFVEHL